MPRLSRRLPSYRLQKSHNLAVVTLGGKDHYLGPYGSAESRWEYDRLVGEWLAAERHSPATGSPALDLTIDELILRYWDFTRGYYVRDGQPARELDNIKDALRHLRKPYGASPAASFGPVGLKAVRKAMNDSGLARNTVNSRVARSAGCSTPIFVGGATCLIDTQLPGIVRTIVHVSVRIYGEPWSVFLRGTSGERSDHPATVRLVSVASDRPPSSGDCGLACSGG